MYWKLEQDPEWRPYCLVCMTMARMERRSYGFECSACHNKVDRDMHHFNSEEHHNHGGNTYV